MCNQSNSLPPFLYIFLLFRVTQILQDSQNINDVNVELPDQFIDFFQLFKLYLDVYSDWHIDSKSHIEYKHQLLSCIETQKECFGNYDHFGKKIIKIDTDQLNSFEVRDGSIYEADNIICIFSLIMQRSNHMNLYQPELSMPKQDKINGLQISLTNQIYLVYETRSWPFDWHGFYLLWKIDDLSKAIESTKVNWLYGVFRFNTIQCKSNILCIEIVGADAIKLMENTTVDDIKIAGLYLLNKFLPNWKISKILRNER